VLPAVDRVPLPCAGAVLARVVKHLDLFVIAILAASVGVFCDAHDLSVAATLWWIGAGVVLGHWFVLNLNNHTDDDF
jgi:ABC-type Co2+ transport system permease subunit